MQRANTARGLRFLPKVATIITVGLISASIAYQASAQVNVYTDPVGFITLTSTANGYSYLAAGMTQIPAARGLVVSVASNQVGIAGLTASQYDTVLAGGVQVPAFYIEDTTSNGAVQGVSYDINTNDASFVYLSAPVNGIINVGDNFKIFPHQTLNTVFGNANQYAIVFGSNTSAEADNIYVWNPASQQNVGPFFYRSQGSIGWRGPAGSTIDAGNTPLYIDQGIEIQRKQVSGTNVNFQVVGAVKLGPTITSVPGGPGVYVYVANMDATSHARRTQPVHRQPEYGCVRLEYVSRSRQRVCVESGVAAERRPVLLPLAGQHRLERPRWLDDRRQHERIPDRYGV